MADDDNVCLLELEKRKSASLAGSLASSSKHSMGGTSRTSKTQLPTSDSLDSFNAYLCGMKRELSKDTVEFSLQPSNEYLESHQPLVQRLVRSYSRVFTEDEEEDYMGRPLPEVAQEPGHYNNFEMEQIDSNDCNISIASSVTDYGELFPDKEKPALFANSCDNNFTDDEVAAGWHMHSIDRDPDYHSFNQVMHRPSKANEKIMASDGPPPEPVSEKRSSTKSASSRKSSSKKSSESLSTRKSKSSRKSSSKKSLSSKNDPSVPSEKASSEKPTEKKPSTEKVPSEKVPSEKVPSEKKPSSEKVAPEVEVKSEPPAEPVAPPPAPEEPKKSKDKKKKGGKGGCFMDAAKQAGCGNPFFNPFMFGCNPMKYIDVKECDKSGNVVMMIKKPKNKMMYYYDSSADEGGCGGGAPGPSQGQGGTKLPDINLGKKKTAKDSGSNNQTKFPNPSSMGQMPPIMNPMMNPMANPYMSGMPNPYMSGMPNPYMMQGMPNMPKMQGMPNMPNMQAMQNMMAQAARRNRKEPATNNA